MAEARHKCARGVVIAAPASGTGERTAVPDGTSEWLLPDDQLEESLDRIEQGENTTVDTLCSVADVLELSARERAQCLGAS